MRWRGRLAGSGWYLSWEEMVPVVSLPATLYDETQSQCSLVPC